MTETHSKKWDQAETAFGKTQTDFIARSRPVTEIDEVAALREEKTARLRKLRLEQEALGPALSSTAKSILAKKASIKTK